ncbi:transcriptional regulator [Lactobacillus delbrueckii subsp. bulgaricus]|nr:helix-turn-helix transcriptional regulator [Lactobacillus delbrueckii]MBT8804041.1 transcriptional regulator [Lactobacillus delbrueckii subsp. bulgaricus]MBT8807100.1 transcriptional regulator [Lactobacillus delbrueckii subsp. bulgaricus]MBT8811963.1 transcriptional regulator [Lactobacillus delbrueckii subsp. bulgaricus]MBT8816595.1 transcriptional regulator [Lactobacillus delbrueckii subsp. bulgaricus]MBT8818079.1 transcriptional regulator [Lactobacillus delbrueckii subsp. bulgaricus]
MGCSTKVGELLKRIRSDLGLSQKQMAGMTMSVTQYSRIESGDQRIIADDLFEILTAQQVSARCFVDAMTNFDFERAADFTDVLLCQLNKGESDNAHGIKRLIYLCGYGAVLEEYEL